jgi:integrase
VRKYLSEVETLRKPNTYRKYECVLERFLEFFKEHHTIEQITSDDLTSYIIALKKDHSLGANTILHNAVIVAQFFKRLGRPAVTKGLQLPERITPLPPEYRETDLAKFFKAAYDAEKALYSTFLLTGFREMEVVHLYWSDINFDLQTARVTSKPDLGFYPNQAERARVIKALQNKGAKLSQLARADLADLDDKAFVVFDGDEMRTCQDAAEAIATVVKAKRPCTAVDLSGILRTLRNKIGSKVRGGFHGRDENLP